MRKKYIYNAKKIIKFANSIRLDVIKTAYETDGKNAHIGGALSMCDILAVLFGSVINLNSRNFH